MYRRNFWEWTSPESYENSGEKEFPFKQLNKAYTIFYIESVSLLFFIWEILPLKKSFLFFFWVVLVFFFLSSTILLLPTHLPPPSYTHAQSCNPMDCSPPGSSVHGLSQARILEWVAVSFSICWFFVLLWGLSVPWVGPPLHCGVWTSRGGDFSGCRAQALVMRASVVVARGL